MLTVRDIEKRTGLSKITIQRYISDGRIHATLEGNKYLIDESELSKLPKPRNTGAQKVEVPQGVPFLDMKQPDSEIRIRELEVKKMELENESKRIDLATRLLAVAS